MAGMVENACGTGKDGVCSMEVEGRARLWGPEGAAGGEGTQDLWTRIKKRPRVYKVEPRKPAFGLDFAREAPWRCDAPTDTQTGNLKKRQGCCPDCSLLTHAEF